MKSRERRESARDHDVEKRLRAPGFHAPFVHFDVVERQLDRGLAQERGLFLIRFGQRDAPLGPRDGERDARQSGARAGIGEARARAASGRCGSTASESSR